IVLQHTDCGITRLHDHPDALAASFGVDVSQLDRKAINDPRAAISIDLAALRTFLPAGIILTGLLYDVDTGQVERVAVPSPSAPADDGTSDRLVTSHRSHGSRGVRHKPSEVCDVNEQDQLAERFERLRPR